MDEAAVLRRVNVSQGEWARAGAVRRGRYKEDRIARVMAMRLCKWTGKAEPADGEVGRSVACRCLPWFVLAQAGGLAQLP
jgi:hypothetical protein